MTYMWSKNKYIEYAINIMLVLLGMNFMHYGQLFLPLICLLIFIDKKGKIIINNWFCFIILCLFSVSFFIFTRKALGFYSVMGFTLPMAYYIGSNIAFNNKNSISKLIVLIAISSAFYIFLTFVFELYAFRNDLSILFIKVRIIDIWTGNKIYPTIMTMHSIMFLAVSYYVLKNYEGIIKYLWLLLFVVLIIYNVSLGRRAILVVLGMSSMLWLFFDLKNIIKTTTARKVLIGTIFFSSIVVFCFALNLFNIKTIFLSSNLIRKILLGKLTERIDYFLQFLKLAHLNLWGGQKISSEIGIQVHDLWSDTYDCAGIISWLLLVIYTIKTFITKIKIYERLEDSSEKKLYIIWWIISFFGLCIEPVMTGCSMYLIWFILIDVAIDNLELQNDS